MPTAAELLTEMRPAWRAALGDRVSPKYLDTFIGRHQRRLEAELEPIAVALAEVPPVSVYELAEDVARRLRGSSEIASALANTPHNFGGELDRQLPKVMLEYLPTIAGGQTQGADTPKNLAIYRRWSDDADFRRKLREQVRELLWERRPGWNSKSSSNEAELEEKKAEQESEARTRLRSTQLRNAAAKLAERRVKVAADSIALLRRQDVERVLNETPSSERRQVAYVLGERRPELVDEIEEVMREVLGEPENWSTYGRDEIYQPGSRAKREATLAEDAAEARPLAWRSSEDAVVSEFEVDGTKCTIFIRPPGYHVRVMDGGLEIELDTLDGADLRARAESSLESMLNPRPTVALVNQALHDSIQERNRQKAERVVHAFTLAAQRIAENRPSNKAVPARDPTPAEAAELERALDAAEPSIDEAERELAALAAEDGKPRPVVMASLEAGGIILLRPHGYLGGDLFKTYRDATSRLQYVSYPKKGQRGIPKVVARAVLALERDGFEVRAETPDVVKSLIVTGGLDHALAVGPPPPRVAAESPARPPTRTTDAALIARVNALAADPPTSTIKYLVKTLRERGDLPLQVKDWKAGGWRPVEAAIEEAEAKEARKLARKPKAERLRAGGEERPAKDANEEHAAQAIVQLANMDPDKARQVNEAGFSKSDVTTGHTLARRWEATGELTGDEWDWAVAVANKYRRQVGPLPEPKSTGKRQSKASGLSAEERLFVGVMPTGIVYADRSREVDGDYARCAFLPFDTLALEMAPKCPKDMIGAIKADAATIIAKRGEQFKISGSDQTVVLGGGERAAQSVSRYTGDYGPNVEQILVHATRVVRGRIPAQVRAELRAAVAAGVLGHLKKDGLKPEVFFHPDHKHGAIDLQRREAEHSIGNIASVMATPQDVRSGMEALGEDVVTTLISRSTSYAGHSLATAQDIAAFLKRSLGKLYEKYMLNINVVRNVGDNSVMLTFYRVPPDASELDAANAKCKVRINIHGAGRTNGSTWPDDATPAELTAYTVWAHNAPKFRKRTGPPSVVVAAVSSWFVLNIADLTGTSTPQGGRLRDVRIDDMDAQVAREEAAMGNALRAERDREEAEWAAAVLHGTKAEIANGLEPEQARRTAIANLGPDIDYYAKRDEEKWGYRP